MALVTKGDPMRMNEYIAASEIKIGDCVTRNSAGQVAVATAGQALCGVSASYAAVAGATVKVFDHPEQMFLAPSSTATPSALTDMGLNYDIVAGVSVGPESAHTLNGASGATTATLPMKVLAASPQVLPIGVNAVAVCIINNHQLKGGTGTVGV